MCGIAGRIDGAGPVERELVEQMCATLGHRGPDFTGVHVREGAGLGMTRLAVIDPQHGAQPMFNENGSIAVVFNGEIYNHHELRRRLQDRGHRFAGRCDAEVLVHLYEEHGEDLVHDLRGMFAFALWDARSATLLLARDRVGKKPLYYATTGAALTFGSEPRAVLTDPCVPRDVDPEALDAFLVNQYVPHDRCAFAALRKVPPAGLVRFTPGREPRVRTYWELDHDPRLPLRAADARALVRELLLDATRARMESDVPLGAFLSGGIDSAAVVAAMVRSTSQTVRTFSVAFAEDGVDESAHARAVAEHLGTDHTELQVGAVDASLLPAVAWHAGEPFADPAALPTYQLAQRARAEITVALTGDGGDEAFGGYRRYRQLALTRPAQALPSAARQWLALTVSARARTREGRGTSARAARLCARLAMDPARRYGDLLRACSDADRRELYGPHLRATLATCDPLAHLARAWDSAPSGLPWGERAMAADLHTYLSDDLVAKVDVTTMAHGLEVRSPLLDHRLLETCARLPARFKRTRGTEKQLLRDAVRDWLPPTVVDRPKHGFELPLAGWLRGPLAHVPRDVLLDPGTRERGMLDPHGIERVIAEHAAGIDRSRLLWTLITLELWFRTCVDVVAPTPALVPALG